MVLPPIDRRTFFKGAAAVMATAAATQLLSACSQTPTPRGYGGDPRPLPIPPLAEGERTGSTVVYRLASHAGDSQILPDVSTRTWGFNGTHLGPTLSARRGEDVTVEITNGLDEMTTVHWHGMKLPAIADGGPHSPIQPGETWEASWTVDNAAATLWYHPHTHGLTELHAYRGLAGFFLIEDAVSESLDIPQEYGVDDIPLVLMDHRFNDDGSLDESDLPDRGLLGDTPTVNGITNAHFAATTRRVRFRILNGSTMRFFNLGFSDERSFSVIASDSGLLSEPRERKSVSIGPGERWEILLDVEPGEELILESTAFPDNFGVPQDEYTPDFGFGDAFQLLTISGPADDTATPPPVPGVLDKAAAMQPDILDAPQRSFVLNTFSINDEMMDMERVDVVIDHQGAEVWEVVNDNSDWPHNFHIHDARFKVLSLDNTDVDIFNEGWKDTVSLPPGARARLAVEFGYYPDPTWPYMYHCHMLYHEDQGMMGQFVIVEPGGRATDVLGAGSSGHTH